MQAISTLGFCLLGYSKSITITQLEQHIAEKIKNLDSTEKDHIPKIARIFVESVLGWEFGNQRFQDTKFNQISH